MIPEASKQALASFVDLSKEEFDAFTKTVTSDIYEKAVEVILEAQKNGNRVHITGIGKPSHVANYMASLLSSTGTPTYFLHGTEAVHGSCGHPFFTSWLGNTSPGSGSRSIRTSSSIPAI